MCWHVGVGNNCFFFIIPALDLAEQHRRVRSQHGRRRIWEKRLFSWDVRPDHRQTEELREYHL